MRHRNSTRLGLTAAVAAVLGALWVWPGTSIGADFVMSRATATASSAAGASNIDGLSVNGAPIPVTGDPNQTIGIPGGLLVLNEQQTLPDGTLVVNALHAIVSGVADVAVASSMAGLTGGRRKAGPAGLRRP